MTIVEKGAYQVAFLEGDVLTEKDRESLLKLTN